MDKAIIMNNQKCKNKVEMWTSKLGNQYQKNQVDFEAAKAELDKIRKLPENKRCADCGTQGVRLWWKLHFGFLINMSYNTLYF